MKDNRSHINAVVRELFLELSLQQPKMLEVVKYGKSKYNLDGIMFTDYINGRQNKDVQELDNITLFMMVDCYDHVMGTTYVEKWFTARETKEWQNIKIQKNEIRFPFKIKCVPVSDDQWIGSITTDTLLDLKNANMINYNPNTQRVMKHTDLKNQTIYYPTVNHRAVEKIKKSFLNHSYIPNTITLNIPEDQDDFHYDPVSCELIIKSLPAFDISDGYHRYLGIIQAKMEDEDFNYPMELRIQHFSESKAQQFIYQEDQKTKMSKLDSDSYNLQAPENQVTFKLNDDQTCNIHGMIA